VVGPPEPGSPTINKLAATVLSRLVNDDPVLPRLLGGVERAIGRGD
jgi:hypothetical protein